MSTTPSREAGLYRVHGLVFASEIELPELAGRRVGAGSPPDVRVRFGEVARPGTALPSTMMFSAAPGGAAFLEVTEVARYLVQGGREVIIDPQEGVDPALVRGFLFGPAFAMICLQRDFLVLHASAVAFGDRAVAFMGDPGAGKSTLAAHCVKAGARLVADDMVRVALANGSPPSAHPGMPLLKLWRHALDALGRDSEGLAPDWRRADKFQVPFSGETVEATVPLERVYVLEQDETAGEGTFERLGGASAVTALIANSHGFRSMDAIDRRPAHFRDCVQLAGSVQVVRLRRRLDPAQLPLTAASIARSLGSASR